MVLFFVLSRVFFFRLGFHFDATPLDWYWQYLDVEVLQTRLWPALWNLHSQPPGFNLFLGAVLKIPGASHEALFHVCYLVFGFLLYYGLYAFLRLSRVSRPWALAAASLFILTPNAIIYETYLFYTYPVCVLLVWAAVMLALAVRSPADFRFPAVFFMLLGVLCLSRAAYHLVYLLACVALVLIPKANRIRKVYLPALAVILCVGLLYTKNAVLFNTFGPSSWTGMNMMRIVQKGISGSRIWQLTQPTDEDAVAHRKPFNKLADYGPAVYSPIQDQTAVRAPELFQPVKRNGEGNFNHITYIEISKQYQTAAITLIRNETPHYFGAVWEAWLVYFKPSWDFVAFTHSAPEAVKYLDGWSRVRRGNTWVDIRNVKKRILDAPRIGRHMYRLNNLLVVPLALLFITLAGLPKAWRLFRHGDGACIPYLFMLGTIWYVALLGNFMEYGENNRFRAETDPLMYLAVCLVLRDAAGFIHRHWPHKKAIHLEHPYE